MLVALAVMSAMLRAHHVARIEAEATAEPVAVGA
jgi:hypothetical protein